jgi:hypothetical protein
VLVPERKLDITLFDGPGQPGETHHRTEQPSLRLIVADKRNGRQIVDRIFFAPRHGQVQDMSKRVAQFV